MSRAAAGEEKYVNWFKNNGRVEGEMTGRLLTYALATIDAFNRVRNEQSLARPNPMLNYQEALLIFSRVVVIFIVNFIRAVESRAQAVPAAPDTAASTAQRDKLVRHEVPDGNEMRWCQVLTSDTLVTGERQQP